MAIAVAKTLLYVRPPLLLCANKARRRSSAAFAVETLHDRRSDQPSSPQISTKKWPTANLKELGIHISIPKPVKSILNGLRKKGFEVYLVGGCVRDVLMKRTPKDFDILTTAELREVKRTFLRCEIVGKRFPICHVHVSDSIIEVSSFSTCARNPNNGLSHNFMRPPDCDDHDYRRWRNCLRRDFTINGLLLNPFSNQVHDYFGGIKDLKKAKVRTVIPPQVSFTEDCARILRAIRVAARLDFNFSRETAHSIVDLANSVLRLDKGRLLMEINYMFAYGSAQASLRMLWRFGLMELIMPIQAAYFASQGFCRRDKRTNMLLVLFSNLDNHLAPDRPCHNSLWIALLAFHEALVQKPRDALVVATFVFALSNGGDIVEAVKIARAKTLPPDVSFQELLKPQEWCRDRELVNSVLDLASSVRTALRSMTDEFCVAKAMKRYPQAPFSDLVFIPLQTYLSACRVFECVGGKTKESGYDRRRRHKPNYSNLALGSLPDVRFIFSQVVLDTLCSPNLKDDSSEDLPEGLLTS